MERRRLIALLVGFMALGPSAGQALSISLPTLAPDDTIQELHAKLRMLLIHSDLQHLDHILLGVGARGIGILSGAYPDAPDLVTAIFGISRGALKNDLRLRAVIRIGEDRKIAEVVSVETFPK